MPNFKEKCKNNKKLKCKHKRAYHFHENAPRYCPDCKQYIEGQTVIGEKLKKIKKGKIRQRDIQNYLKKKAKHIIKKAKEKRICKLFNDFK